MLGILYLITGFGPASISPDGLILFSEILKLESDSAHDLGVKLREKYLSQEPGLPGETVLDQ